MSNNIEYKKWVLISFAFLAVLTSLMYLQPDNDGMGEMDEKVRKFLIQVHKEKNESYFIEHLYDKYRASNDVTEDQIKALRLFLKKIGKLERILVLEGELGSFLLEDGELLIANYIVVADYGQQKKLKYAISFVKVESELQFYGFSYLD